MPYEVTSMIFRQLFPKGVLPTAIAAIAAALVSWIWFITKKEESFLINKVHSFLKNRPKVFVKLARSSYVITLIAYGTLVNICPEIKLGFLLNATVLVFMCLLGITAICFMTVSDRIINSDNDKNKETKLDS